MVTQDQTGTDIECAAEQAARDLLDAIPTLKDTNWLGRNFAIARALHTEQGPAAQLMAVFKDDPSFGDLRGGWIQLGGSGHVIQAHTVPHRLISNVIDGHSAKSYVEKARAFAASPKSTTTSFTPLAGVKVAEIGSLHKNIDLVPWRDVPDSNQKRVFDPVREGDAVELSAFVPIQLRASAGSAIRIHLAERQVLFSSYKEAKAAQEALASSANNQATQVRDLVRCITVLSMRGVATLGNWVQFDDDFANDISASGYSHSANLFDNAVLAASHAPIMLDGEATTRLFDLFERFKPSDKNALRIGMDRLNQALRRQDIVDKAIDLGIALEVMLLHGIGPKDRGELSFRSSIRGATYLGGEKQERLRNFKLLRDAYTLRSKAVHSGALKEEKSGTETPPGQILEEATSICARIARNLIERGSFPEWEAEYVIGGESLDSAT